MEKESFCSTLCVVRRLVCMLALHDLDGKSKNEKKTRKSAWRLYCELYLQ